MMKKRHILYGHDYFDDDFYHDEDEEEDAEAP